MSSKKSKKGRAQKGGYTKSSTGSSASPPSGPLPDVIVTVLPPSTEKGTHPAQHFDADDNMMSFGFQLPVMIDKEGKVKEKKVLCLVNEKGETIPCLPTELKKRDIRLVAPPFINIKTGNRISNAVLEQFQKSRGTKPLVWDLPDYLKVVTDTMREVIDFGDDDFFLFLALWNIGTYCHRLFPSFAYCYFTGPTGTGKTRVMEILERIAFNGMLSPNMSPASLFRAVESQAPTLLMDETETLAQTDKSAEVRQLVLSGYKAGAQVMRAEKTESGYVTATFGTYSPKCFANIRGLDDVLENRCITTLMQRSNDDKVMTSRVDSKSRKTKWQMIRDQSYLIIYKHWRRLAQLSESHADKEIVEGVTGRSLELWSPAFIMAQLFEEEGCTDLMDTMARLAKRQVAEMLERFKDSISGQLIRAIDGLLASNSYQDDYYPQKDLREYFARQVAFSEEQVSDNDAQTVTVKTKIPNWVSPKFLTKHLRALAITKYMGSGGTRKVFLSKEILKDRWTRYFGEWKEPVIQGTLETFESKPVSAHAGSGSVITPNGNMSRPSSGAAMMDVKDLNPDVILAFLAERSLTWSGIRDECRKMDFDLSNFDAVMETIKNDPRVDITGTTPEVYRWRGDNTGV